MCLASIDQYNHAFLAFQTDVPVLSATASFMEEESLALNKTMVADCNSFWLMFFTDPLIFPFPRWAVAFNIIPRTRNRSVTNFFMTAGLVGWVKQYRYTHSANNFHTDYRILKPLKSKPPAKSLL